MSYTRRRKYCVRSGIFGIILTVILYFNEISDLSNQKLSNSVLFTNVKIKDM